MLTLYRRSSPRYGHAGDALHEDAAAVRRAHRRRRQHQQQPALADAAELMVERRQLGDRRRVRRPRRACARCARRRCAPAPAAAAVAASAAAVPSTPAADRRRRAGAADDDRRPRPARLEPAPTADRSVTRSIAAATWAHSAHVAQVHAQDAQVELGQIAVELARGELTGAVTLDRDGGSRCTQSSSFDVTVTANVRPADGARRTRAPQRTSTRPRIDEHRGARERVLALLRSGEPHGTRCRRPRRARRARPRRPPGAPAGGFRRSTPSIMIRRAAR